jgi:hypothetical protein
MTTKGRSVGLRLNTHEGDSIVATPIASSVETPFTPTNHIVVLVHLSNDYTTLKLKIVPSR